MSIIPLTEKKSNLVGSGSTIPGSGSADPDPRGSADPDPHQNEADPKH